MRFHLRRRGPEPEHWPPLDDAAAGWIRAARRPFAEYSVGSLVPVAFERYARILHPALAASDMPVSWDAVARWSGRSIHALAQWESLSRPLGEPNAVCPFVQAPDTGGLPPQQLRLLCALLAAASSTADRCFFAVWEGFGWLADAELPPASELRLDQRTFHVYQGPIEVAGRIGWRSPDGRLIPECPTLIWPADCAWFVASDVDLDSTYVGGSEMMITALLAEPGLEAWTVDPADRVTFDSDTINRA